MVVENHVAWRSFLAGAAVIAAMLVPGVRAAEGPNAETSISALQRDVLEAFKSEDWERSRQLIQQMAALDPDHPKVYLQAILLQQRRGALGEAMGELDRLGLRSVPGRLYGEGILAVMERRHDAAREPLARALEEYGQMGHAAGRAAAHTALGNLERRQGQLEQAAESYEAARADLKAIGDRQGLVDIVANLAKLEREMGRPAEAASRQREVLAIRVELGEVDGQARSLHEIGVCLLEAGDPAGALEALGRALELRRGLGDRPAQITTLRVIAEALARTNDFAPALQRLSEARAIAAALGDKQPEAQVIRQIGDVSLAADRPRVALEAFEAAASMFDRLEDALAAAQARSWAGTSLNRLGEFRRAASVLEGVLGGPAASADKALQAATLTELGATALATGDLLGALQTQERALDLHRELKNDRGALANRINLGVVQHALGDSRRAMSQTQEAVRAAEGLPDAAARARARNNLGVLLAERGDDAEATRELESAAQVWEALGDDRGRAAAWANIAEIETRQGRTGSAAARLDAALDLLRRDSDLPPQAALLNQKGGLQRLARAWDAAASAHRQALEIARERGLMDEEWRALLGLAACSGASGRPEDGLELGLEAIRLVEQARARLGTGTLKLRFLADKIGLHETVLGLMLPPEGATDDVRIRDSFDVAERARARGLLDQIAEAAVRRGARIDPDLLAEESVALDRVGAAMVRLAGDDDAQRAEARRQIEQAEEQLRRVELLIDGAGPARTAPATVAQVQAELRDDEALLEYFVGERTSWLWTITRKEAIVRELPPAASIRDLVERVRDELASQGGAFDAGRRSTSAELGRTILPAGSVPPGARLLVVADDVLHQVPFEALPVGGDLLVEKHEVALVPSASILCALRRQRMQVAAAGFLGVAAPTGAGGPPLPFARQEVDRIAGLFPQDDRLVLQGDQATKGSLEKLDLTRFRFVHFATHGWLDPTDLRHSGLRLATAGGDEAASLLTLPEIQSMRLSASVVVLSSCESGLGELLRGEGVLGLTHAFLRAGAAAVVVSLWSVADDSTADFMEFFYKELLAGQPASAALRRAKLAFLDSDRPARRSATRWAPFVLAGEPGVTAPHARVAGP